MTEVADEIAAGHHRAMCLFRGGSHRGGGEIGKKGGVGHDAAAPMEKEGGGAEQMELAARLYFSDGAAAHKLRRRLYR